MKPQQPVRLLQRRLAVTPHQPEEANIHQLLGEKQRDAFEQSGMHSDRQVQVLCLLQKHSHAPAFTRHELRITRDTCSMIGAAYAFNQSNTSATSMVL